MAQIISKRYARALFDVAKQQNKVEEYYKELNEVKKIMLLEDVERIFKNKSINKTHKIKFMDDVLKGINSDIINFIKLVIAKHREDIIFDIFEQFEILYKDYNKIVDAKIISAHLLEQDIIDKVKNSLESNLNKKVNIETSIDKSIIGGLKIIIGNRIIDGSVKGRLDSLLKTLEEAM